MIPTRGVSSTTRPITSSDPVEPRVNIPLRSIARTLISLLVYAACPDAVVGQVDSDEPYRETIQLFEAGYQGYRTYRIPALAITPQGTLLAAVAARFDGHGDWVNIDTMLRRSTDGGKTWTPQEIVTDDGRNTVDNATFIVDSHRGNVYLMYQINYARAYLKAMENEGERWSAPREVTNVFEVFRDRDRYDWEVLAMGPGHGIVLENGRFVVPVWLSTSHKHRPSIAATIYSDDQGDTWRAGEVIATTTEAIPNPSEHALIELPDGRVMTNMRTESRQYRRMLSYSPDGATGWTQPVVHDQLIEPICMGSMGRLSNGTILFTNPNSQTPRGRGSGSTWGARVRQNLTLRASADAGTTWHLARALAPGNSGYSDIAVGPLDELYVLYESGAVNDEGAFIPSGVTFTRFNLAWLKQAN